MSPAVPRPAAPGPDVDFEAHEGPECQEQDEALARRNWGSARLSSRPAWIGPPRRPRPSLRVEVADTSPGVRGFAPVEVAVVSPGLPLPVPPALSVAIAVRNDLPRLRDCLAALSQAADGLCVQTVVVDSGSTDRTTSTLLAEFPAVTLLRTAADLGPAWSIDIALARCQGPVLLLVDCGARPRADDLHALLAHLAEHPRCAVVSAGLAAIDGTPLPGSAPLPTLRHLLVEESGLARLMPHHRWLRRLSTLEQDAAAGPCSACPPAGLLAVRREALDDVGPYDTDLPYHSFQLDWFRRLRKGGWEVHLAADLRVPFEAGELPDARDTWRRHRDRIRYARKHHGPAGVRAATLSLWSWALVEAAARLAGRGPAAQRGLFGALDALIMARRTRAMA